MKIYWKLIKAIWGLSPARREQFRQLASEYLRGRIRSWMRDIREWPSAFVDRIRLHLISLLAGKSSVLINVKIIGAGNSIKMSDPALFMNVELDAGEPAADEFIIVANDVAA